MIGLGAIAGIAVVELGMVLTPGPNMVYLVSRSIAQGRRAGLVSPAGVALGFLVYLVAVSAGIATVFALVPEIYLAIKLAGAGYLLWLAWKAVRPGGRSAFAPQELAPDGDRKLFLMGLLTCVLNPKVAILYISLLPRFVDPERGDVGLQGLLLGAHPDRGRSRGQRVLHRDSRLRRRILRPPPALAERAPLCEGHRAGRLRRPDGHRTQRRGGRPALSPATSEG
ncbi:LysE family translocator [Streptomyces albus]|uniref:LysE family translocator n=1 Tax=Streptomyces albus TaxID=1888 RepID=UPI003D1069DF